MNQEPNRESITCLNFDTVNTITIYHTNRDPLYASVSLCERFDQNFNKFRENSDLWRVNHADGKPVEVDASTADIISLAIAYSQKTNGVFDISIGSVNACWRFSDAEPSLPNREHLSQKIGLVDYHAITVRGNTVQVPSGMQLDLGGIAKGYITDQIVKLLKSYGVPRGTISLGGNVYVMGWRPDGCPWHVGIQTPGRPVGTYCGILLAENQSVVTSGIYERGFDRDEIRYHHILDPRTGWPVQNDLASITLVTRQSVDGDALSTACLCLGMNGAKDLISTLPGMEAVFITRDGSFHWTGRKENFILPTRQK